MISRWSLCDIIIIIIIIIIYCTISEFFTSVLIDSFSLRSEIFETFNWVEYYSSESKTHLRERKNTLKWVNHFTWLRAKILSSEYMRSSSAFYY